MSFKTLIHLTKQAEKAEQHYHRLVDSKADAQDIQVALNALIACQGDVSTAAISAFANAREGDDIHVISGRALGDDNDGVGVFFSGSPGSVDAINQFVINCLNMEVDDSEDQEQYTIVTDLTLDGYLL